MAKKERVFKRGEEVKLTRGRRGLYVGVYKGTSHQVKVGDDKGPFDYINDGVFRELN